MAIYKKLFSDLFSDWCHLRHQSRKVSASVAEYTGQVLGAVFGLRNKAALIVKTAGGGKNAQRAAAAKASKAHAKNVASSRQGKQLGVQNWDDLRNG